MATIDLIDWTLLRKCLTEPFEWFESMGEVRVAPDGRKHIFMDGGANLLGVAHLDSVVTSSHFLRGTVCGRDTVFASTVDDRLGAYILLDLLPKMGMFYDILFTTDEEKGRSTGRDFVPSRPYNWMFMFDRGGTDAVRYQYTDVNWVAALKGAGFKVERGASSCIALMEHMKCCGVNVGTAYYDYHDRVANFDVEELCEQVEKFVCFWADNGETMFPFVPPPPVTTWVAHNRPATSGSVASAGVTSSLTTSMGHHFRECWNCEHEFHYTGLEYAIVEGELVEMCEKCMGVLSFVECPYCEFYHDMGVMVAVEEVDLEVCPTCVEQYFPGGGDANGRQGSTKT